MRTLTAVFAPGSAPLPEGLRTLTVSPSRIVEPGQTIHASFTFRNLGGGTATGFRVRFRLPEGLTYLVGSAQIDGVEIDEQGGLTSLLQSAGAKLGEVPAGGERRISLAYSVAPTIENGTQIGLQAALASFEVPVIGSNVVRLLVRSKPTLKSGNTKLSLTPVRELVPGAELHLRAQIHNSGQSSAHDVMVLLPVPANTTYVPHSAVVDGRPRAGLSEVEPLGLTTPTIVAPMLGPGATLDVGYRVRIDPTLDDNAQVNAHGAVCTQELPEFALSSVTLKVPSKPSFEGEDTSFRVETEDEVVPGQRVRMVVHLRNAGTARAKSVRVRVKLPDGIAYSAGSRAIDGAPAVDADREPGVFELGDVEPGRSVEVSLAGVVVSPSAHGAELPLEARIDWQKTNRAFARTLTVRSTPAFPGAFNRVERETPRRLNPGDAAKFTIHLENMGADVATDARVRLELDEALENVHVTENDAEVELADDRSIHLDTVEPNAPRRLNVEARIAAIVEDQSQLRLHAALRTKQLGEIDLGSAQHTIASRPRFAAKSSKLAAESGEVLRPNRTMACRLTVHNIGTDRGKDVRVRLQLPEELRLESVDNASRDAESVVFGEVPAQAAREATVHLRLLGTAADGEVLQVNARLTGSNVVPLSLEPVSLTTHAEPAFDEGATLTSHPMETIDSGQEIVYTLALRNSGDGPAKRLNARIDTPLHTVYAPGSTMVNDLPLLDFAGTSPLLAPNGLTLGDVTSGAEVVVQLSMIVNTPLPPGTSIETRAHVTWDEVPEMIVRAEALRVRSASALPIVDPALPFSVLDAAAGPTYANGRRALGPGEQAAYIELPPAQPVRGALPRDVTGTRSGRSLPTGHSDAEDSDTDDSDAAHVDATLPDANAPDTTHPDVTLSLSKGEPNAIDTPTALYLSLPEDRLDWIVHYLEEARFEGLIAHLMVIRALFPDTAEAPEATARLRQHTARLNELVDRLFLKLRLPDVPLTPDDLETPTYRASLVRLIEALRTERGQKEPDRAGLRLAGFVEPRTLAAAAATLDRAKLVTAVPWMAVAMLMGTSLEREGLVVADFASYRDAVVRAFSELAELTATEFERALHEPSDVELEVGRENVLRDLTAQRNIPA
jgi:uncharacterized repeat protein (TIGR01451 family)